ncbi:hypothetical protein D3C77_568850 [compost metagenome]
MAAAAGSWPPCGMNSTQALSTITQALGLIHWNSAAATKPIGRAVSRRPGAAARASFSDSHSR